MSTDPNKEHSQPGIRRKTEEEHRKEYKRRQAARRLEGKKERKAQKEVK